MKSEGEFGKCEVAVDHAAGDADRLGHALAPLLGRQTSTQEGVVASGVGAHQRLVGQHVQHQEFAAGGGEHVADKRGGITHAGRPLLCPAHQVRAMPREPVVRPDRAPQLQAVDAGWAAPRFVMHQEATLLRAGPGPGSGSEKSRTPG